MLQLLKSTLCNAHVVIRNNYRYFQHPIADGAPAIEPKLLTEICNAIIKIANIDVDLILTIEAAGIHIASALSLLTNIPFNFVRKSPRYLENELELIQVTGYSKSQLYLNVQKNINILLVDTVISTGGTFCAVINGLKKRNCNIKDIVCVIERGDGKQVVEKTTGYNVKTLVKIEVNEKVRVVRDYFSA